MYSDVDRPAELARIASQTATGGARSVSVTVRHTYASAGSPNLEPQTRVQKSAADSATGDHQEGQPALGSSSRNTLIRSGDHPAVSSPDQALPPGHSEDQSRSMRNVAVLEELAFGVFGASTTISTAVSRSRAQGEDSDVKTWRIDSKRKGREFEANMPPNPTFLYEYADTVEVLVGFGEAWRPTYRDSLFFTYAVRELSAAAADTAQAPILFTQAPVAPAPNYPAGDGSKESHRISLSNTIRLSVAISRGRPAARMDFLSDVVRFASDNGLSCHISDPKSDRVRGDWFEVLPSDPPQYLKARDTRFGAISDTSISRTVTLSIIGPARTGSTLTVASQLANCHMGVVACSISSMSEIAVINLTLAVAPTITSHFLATAGSSIKDVPTGIRSLRRLCSLDGQSAEEFPVDYTLLGSYRMLRSEPSTVSAQWDPADSAVTYPLWAAWDLPEGRGRLVPIAEHLVASLAGRVAQVELSYGRTRLTSTGRRRGRAKVSIRLREGVRLSGISSELRGLAERMEDHLRFELLQTGEAEAGIHFRVTARERWLGRWRLPM